MSKFLWKTVNQFVNKLNIKINANNLHYAVPMIRVRIIFPFLPKIPHLNYNKFPDGVPFPVRYVFQKTLNSN